MRSRISYDELGRSDFWGDKASELAANEGCVHFYGGWCSIAPALVGRLLFGVVLPRASISVHMYIDQITICMAGENDTGMHIMPSASSGCSFAIQAVSWRAKLIFDMSSWNPAPDEISPDEFLEGYFTYSGLSIYRDFPSSS